MIRAHHIKFASSIAKFYLNRRFRKNFSAFYMAQYPEIPAYDGKPVLLLPNHSTWWDGFFIFWLNQNFFKRIPYLMMLEQQLMKFPYFKYLGAYSINKNNTGSVRESLQYTLNLLNHDSSGENLVILFPQGELAPFETRPIHFEKGLSLLLKKINRPVIIQLLAMHAFLGKEEMPEVVFYFDHPIEFPDKDVSLPYLEARMNNLLSDLTEKLISGEGPEAVFFGKKSIHKRFGMD